MPTIELEFDATNHFVYVLRDEADREKDGFLIPDIGQEPTSVGTLLSVGFLAKDPKIKRGAGKKIKFFKGAGFEQEIDGVTYLVLTDDQITGISKK